MQNGRAGRATRSAVMDVSGGAAGLRYLDALTALFITTLITCNVVSSKTASFAGFTVGVGIFVFPISYVLGDVLTEVYGYRRSRRVIWLGFASAAMASVIFFFADIAPPSRDYHHQQAFHAVIGQSPFVLAASLLAYFAGEFCNSYVLAKMKIWSSGRMLWMRTIGSTIVGEAVDSLVFYPIAFGIAPRLLGFTEGAWDWPLIGRVMIANYVLKVLVEVVLTPVTYRVVALLKRKEGVDVYDHGTDFNPFLLRS